MILGVKSNIKIGIYFNMRFKDIFLTLMIILIFAFVFCIGFFTAGYKNIKNNWPDYACTPMVMPFASQFGHDTGENFTKCIGNMQSGMMGVFTAPLHFVTGTLLTSIENLAENVADLRNLQNFMRYGRLYRRYFWNYTKCIDSVSKNDYWHEKYGIPSFRRHGDPIIYDYRLHARRGLSP